MGRIRTIKPEFFHHERLSELPAETHLFAAGLLTYADDEGYFNANPGLVKAGVFPLRESSLSIHCMFTDLSNAGFLRFGLGPDGRRYGHVVEFLKHQRVNRPTPSKISCLDIVWESSVSPHGALSESSLLEQGTGNREQGKDTPQKAANGFDLSGLPEDLTPAVWADFLKARKVNRKPISTQTAVDRVAASLHRCKQAGFSPDYALGEAIERGWQSVKLDWLQNTGKGQQPTTGPKLKLLVDQDA